jgi:hypothetical protein
MAVGDPSCKHVGMRSASLGRSLYAALSLTIAAAAACSSEKDPNGTSSSAGGSSTASTPASSSVGPSSGGSGGATAAWTQLGFEGSIVATIAIDPTAPSTVFIGLAAGSADSGVHRSQDGGETWTKLGGGLPDEFTGQVAVDPQGGSVLANPGAAGIYRSLDGGDTWSQSVAHPGGVNGFLHHPTSQTVWTVTSQQGAFRSMDDGATWQQAANAGLPLNQFTLGPLAYDGAQLYLGTDGQGIYVSTDDGDSWTKAPSAGLPDAPSGGSMLNIAASPTVAGVLYVQTLTAGIFRSDDGAASFTELDTAPNRTRYAGLRIAPGATSTIYVSTDETQGGAGGLLRSTDDGQSWEVFGPAMQPAGVVDVAPDGTVFAGTIGHGVWRHGI